MTINISQENFGTLCICAIRYCQGRETYMPSLVQSICKAHLKELSDKDLAVMIDDCRFQRNMNLYGDEHIDKPDWLKWEETLLKEKEDKMTSEEAIRFLNEQKEFLLKGCFWEETRMSMNESFDMAIEALEAQRWVSASKKLPEYHESVLTWDGVCYSVEKRIPYICDDDGEHIESDWWVSDDYDEEESEYYPNLRDGTCIAWMRFPGYTEEEG